MGAAILTVGIILALCGTLALVLAARERGRRNRVRVGATTGLEPSGDLAERRRREAFEHFPTIALRVDGTCRVVEANAMARQRFPFLREGLVLLDAFTEHELAARAAEALATEQVDDFQVRLFAEGRRTYRVVVAPYALAGDREAVVFLTDTSEAVAYQELRSQFVANVSHELRTPLTGLRGLLEALEDPRMEPETQARFVARARRETERLEALISDILFLSELEATHGLPSAERSDLRNAALTAVETWAAPARDHDVGIEVDAPAPAWTPLTDRMTRTVVGNLLENAVKYAGPGARARISVRADGDRAVLEVEDDGAGIAQRHLPHVFERFYRADPSRSKQLGGTGLGLSIVKHIAERFGGQAEARSREGFGTTVRVTLPAVAPPPDLVDGEREGEPEDAGAPRVP